MNTHAFSEIEVAQVVDVVKTACIVIAIAILSRRLVEAQSESERNALAQTLFRVVGMTSGPSPELNRGNQPRYQHDDDQDDGFPPRPGYAFR